MTVTFEDIAAKKEELDALMKDYGEQALKDLLLNFFGNHPQVQKIHWTQYTPYFNDGDECIFGITEIGIRIDPEVVDKFTNELFKTETSDHPGQSLLTWYIDGEEDDPYTYYIDSPIFFADEDTNLKVDFFGLTSTLYANEEVLKMAFGDHVEITCTPTAINVEFYDHE